MIGGPVLTCLAQIATLESISFENNRFGTEPLSTEEIVTIEARVNGNP